MDRFLFNFHLCYFIFAFKMQLELMLGTSLGTLSPSTFRQQVIHNHPYVSPLPSFRDHSYMWKGF